MSRLDPAAIENLRELGGDEFVEELTETFLDEAPGLLATLHGRDAGEVRRAAHTLKSNAATFGATRLADLCLELETQAREADGTTSPELATDIEAEYALVSAELRG
jgi:HPt (histidine-containing phosphotransfer) domain-containing protein